MTVRRVLVVAENDALVDGIAAWLATSPDVTVVGRAHSGAEAVDRAQRLRPDLAIVDSTLQDMTGFEAARWLRSLHAAPRILIMTFHDTRTAELAALAAGADGFVAKPEIPERLLPKIAELFLPAEEPAGTIAQGIGPDTHDSKLERRDSKMRQILKNRLLPAILAIVGTALVGGNARALSLPDTNLVDLIRHSNSIVAGKVTDVTDGVNEFGLPYTEVTIEIDETIRGVEGGTYSFRQIGLREARLTEDGTRRIPAAPEGIPRYEAGENVLLFLSPAASITGLRTTTGLGYGKFEVGAGRAENDLGNRGVFGNISVEAGLTGASEQRIFDTTQGAVNPDDLLSLVRRAVNNSWVENCKMWNTDDGKTCRSTVIDRPRAGRRTSTVIPTTGTGSTSTGSSTFDKK